MRDEKGPAPPPITFSPFVRTSYDLHQWDRSARPFTRANAILPSPTAIMDHAAVVYILRAALRRYTTTNLVTVCALFEFSSVAN